MRSPTGIAMIPAMPATSRVPVTSGRTPKRCGAERGAHSLPKKKSVSGTAWKNANVSKIRTRTMPNVVRTLTPAAPSRRVSTTRSVLRRRRMSLRSRDARETIAIDLLRRDDVAHVDDQLVGLRAQVVLHELLDLGPC